MGFSGFWHLSWTSDQSNGWHVAEVASRTTTVQMRGNFAFTYIYKKTEYTRHIIFLHAPVKHYFHTGSCCKKDFLKHPLCWLHKAIVNKKGKIKPAMMCSKAQRCKLHPLGAGRPPPQCTTTGSSHLPSASQKPLKRAQESGPCARESLRRSRGRYRRSRPKISINGGSTPPQQLSDRLIPVSHFSTSSLSGLKGHIRTMTMTR